jgi:hypothetical protein
VALLAILVFFSIYLALNRIYQVDECQNVFMGRTLGTGQSGSYFTNAPLWLMGPLAWLARSAKASADMFMWGRLVFLGVFWLNLTLMALATGVKVRSLRGAFILLMAATLAPLWDYGFEIRHDNLILTGLLLMWWLGRTRPRGLSSYFLLGLLAVLMQFIAFKAFLFALPLSAAFLLFPHPNHRQPRVRLFGAWVSGGVIAFLLCRAAYGFAGLWPVYLAGFQGGVSASGTVDRFGAWIALQRPLGQTPLLLAILAAAVLVFARELGREGQSALRWDSHAPECLLFLGALALLLVNPTPFPYNLVNLIPFGFLLACRFLDPLVEEWLEQPRGPAVALGLLLFAHAAPFSLATWRHISWDNARQESIMSLAEKFTDPAKDRVYDAVGLVPSRSSINFRWFLHTLNIRSFTDGKSASVSQMLEAQPAAVIIPNYRMGWLPASDWDFIHHRYVPLSDDFWVLGQALPAGGGSYSVVHPGRYQLIGRRGGPFQPLTGAQVDGKTAASASVELGLGPHEFKCPMDTVIAIVWLGPTLNQLPDPGRGDRNRLFVNWY